MYNTKLINYINYNNSGAVTMNSFWFIILCSNKLPVTNSSKGQVVQDIQLKQ